MKERRLEGQPPETQPNEEAGAVLVVDDNAANLLAVDAILSPLGCDTVSVLSGEEALKQLLRRRFAVILMDVQMPGMDGFEAAATIKTHPRMADVPIIFVTAISREAMHVFKGYSLGAVDYLLKPFEPEILRAKVAVFIELYRKEEKIRAQASALREHELREARRVADARYRGLAESVPLPMWRLKSDGAVLATNRAWSEYSGLDDHGTGNLFDSGAIHPDDEGPLRQKWMDSGRSHLASFEMEGRLRRAGGEYRWHLFRVVAEVAERGRPGAWVVTATDHDDQRRAREEAEAANRLKDDFLATVSHELRTPLNAIVGWTRMLREGMLDEKQSARAIEAIERNAQAQTALVNDLLDVSRIISGKLRLHLETLRLRDVVGDAVETVRPDADKKGVRIVVAGDDPCLVDGDRARLQQVIWNLLSNAVKFTPPGGHVEVTVTEREQLVEVAVADTGVGISPEFLPYVFDRFRQEDSSLSRSEGGLGLGLSIVRQLVELHGGVVAARTAPVGTGSVFVVHLPRSSGVPLPAPSGQAWFSGTRSDGADLPREHRLQGVKVLLVEDQPDARDMVAEMLRQQGASVVAVESADQALAQVRLQVPDVVVSDIGLPGNDGYSFIRALRALPPAEGGGVPAVAVTGYASSEDGDRALREGFQMHLPKPVEREELVATLSSLTVAAPGAPAF